MHWYRATRHREIPGPITIPHLSTLPLFAQSDRSELVKVQSLLTAVLVAAGEVLIHVGDTARQFFIIADGEVSVVDRSGHEVAVLGPGAVVGEIGLLCGRARGATVTALTPLVAYAGNRREFDRLLEVAPAVDRHVTHLALARLGPR